MVLVSDVAFRVEVILAVCDSRSGYFEVSFLVGKDGKIAHITDDGSADVHLAEMKDAVAKLTKN